MERHLLILLLLVYCSDFTYGQPVNNNKGNIEVERLMDSLWIHPTSFINHNDPNWIRLNQHLQEIDILQLNEMIHSIYYGSNSFLLNRSIADKGFIGTLNRSADDKKLNEFHRRIRKGFRDPELHPDNKIVMIEGDSWFEYPVFLHDITDHLEKKPNLAIYTLAKGGDWISNMISTLNYEFEYAKIKPDVFIISGGGNDLVAAISYENNNL